MSLIKNSLMAWWILAMGAGCFWGCSEEVPDSLESLESKGVFAVDVPPTLPLTTTCLKANVKDGGDVLYFLDKNNREIVLIDLNEWKISGTIRVPAEGPDAPGKFTGFTVLKGGSVLIAPSGKPRLYLVDRSGKVRKRFDLDYHISRQDVTYCPLVSRLYLDASYENGQLFLPQQLYGLPSALSFQNIRHSLLFSWDERSGKGRFCNVFFPSDYFDQRLLPKNFSACTNGILYIFSLQGKEELIVYDRVSDKSHEVVAKSAFVDAIAPMAADDMESWMDYEARNPSYESILFDPFRQRYYRFVKLGASPEEIKTYGVDQLYRFPMHFSVIILDEQFRKKGETRFDGLHYKMDNAFVGRHGLYLSRANPLAPDYSEDSLRFELFELVAK